MRAQIVAQPELDFHPSHLKITNNYYDKYAAISEILDENPLIIDLVHKDVAGALSQERSVDKGGRRFAYATETLVRILIVGIVEGHSLRQTVIRVDDSHTLRRFVRIDTGPMMDFTTLDRLKNAICPETWAQLNEELTRYAVREKAITGESLRVDTTAVETNIHWPTDSSLLWDVYRVLARSIETARELDADAAGKKRLRTKRVKRIGSQIARLASSKHAKTRKKIQKLYKRLIEAILGIMEWSQSVVEALMAGISQRRYGFLDAMNAQVIVDEMVHYRGLGDRVVDQARRRVIEEQQVPNEEKLFSIFEPHTELLKRGKPGKPIEFGHMIEIRQVESKFITGYDIFKTRPNETALVEPALKEHHDLFGKHPKCFTADKGYYESKEALEVLEESIPTVAIAKKGKRTEAQIEREHAPEFKAAQKFRAGVEGSISYLKRVLGLLRCFNKGWDHFHATVGMTVFAHNLLNLVRR